MKTEGYNLIMYLHSDPFYEDCVLYKKLFVKDFLAQKRIINQLVKPVLLAFCLIAIPAGILL
jgi:hypothetical protein